MKLLICFLLFFLVMAVSAYGEGQAEVEELKKQIVQAKEDLESLRVVAAAFKRETAQKIMTYELITLRNKEVELKQEIVRQQAVNENLRQLLKATGEQTGAQVEMSKMRKDLNVILAEMAKLCAKN
jgi:hypothetical protein